MENKVTNHRQSNIELLRIISILLIISFHYVYKSGAIYKTFTFNVFIIKVFNFFGELGVNLFMLITGYFMINGKFKIKKLILILSEVLFYFLLTTLIGIHIGAISKPITIRSKILIFFPTITSRYWFITAYVLIYILSPYLNIFINAMSKKEYKKFLVTIVILWCITPTIFGTLCNSTESILYYSRFIWLIVIYFIGAYIKLYNFNILKTNKEKLLCAVISFLIMILSLFVMYRFSYGPGINEPPFFWTPNNIFMALLSISIFELFLNIKMKNNRIINTISSTTLGIYLIHDGILCNYIWENIFKAKEHLVGNYPIENILLATFMVFIFGVVVDLLRQAIEKYVLKKIIDYSFKRVMTLQTSRNNQ